MRADIRVRPSWLYLVALVSALLFAAATLLTVQSASAQNRPPERTGPPSEGNASGTDKGPVGWETYRQLDRLPQLTNGVDTKQFSSFDRRGRNNDGFGGLFSCLRQSADGCVIAEKEGAGEIQSIWSTRDLGDVSGTGNIKIELDGKTVLDAPLQDVVDGKVGAPFIHPLVANADQSSGGVYIKVPMPYQESMRITTDNNPFFYNVSYTEFANAEGVQTFDPSEKAQDVIDTLRNAGTEDPKPEQPNEQTTSDSFSLPAGQSTTLAQTNGPGMISELKLRMPQLQGFEESERLTDDGRSFRGYSQLTVDIDPDNKGVRLKRRFDQPHAQPLGSISVDGEEVGKSWSPNDTTGGGWSTESVKLPASVTKGKSEITIRNEFVPPRNDTSIVEFGEYYYWVDSIVDGERERTDTIDVGPNSLDSERAHNYSIQNQTWQGERTYPYPSEEDEKAIAASDDVLQNTRLRIIFDGKQTVDAPLGEFFGSGLGEYEVNSLFTGVEPEDGTYSSWWPMPYRSGANIELVNNSGQDIEAADVELTHSRSPQMAKELGPNGDAAYFRATAKRGDTTPGRDWVFLDTEDQRGKFMGVTAAMSGTTEGGNGPFNNRRAYLEGDERVYVDGSRSPQMHGTGTEDFYQGGWYYERGPFSNFSNGDAAHESAELGCAIECDSSYRLMVGDSVPFDSSFRFSMEHGGFNNIPAIYSTVAFWYGKDRSVLESSDTLDVGNQNSEQVHDYSSPDPGQVQELTSVFEGNFDTRQVTEDLRKTNAPVSFSLDVNQRNEGVVLRRTSDQEDAYQAARVFVNGEDAGVWKQPLGNEHQRWLDDSFQLPAKLTGKSRELYIRLVPLDGSPAWSAARYKALSVVPPTGR